MSQGVTFPLPMKKGFGATDRVDKWWKGPTAMAAYLGFMILYATWRGFMEADFWIFSDFGLSAGVGHGAGTMAICLLYTSPSPRDAHESRMPSSA